MSPESDRLRYEQILRSLLAGRARIVRGALQSDWPAHPGGNIRSRPLFWVNRVDAEQLLELGELAVTDSGLTLSRQTRQRLMGYRGGEGPASETVAKQRMPSAQGSTIIHLSRRRDRSRKRILDAGQVAAAERYTRDLIRAGEGHVSTSDPSTPNVDGTRRHDAAETAMLTRLDARKALTGARDAVGPDLARLLNRVCRDNEKPAAIDKSESWPTGMALHMLRMALTRLSGHYDSRRKDGDDPRHHHSDPEDRPRYHRQ